MGDNQWQELAEGTAKLAVLARIMGLETIAYELDRTTENILLELERARAAKEPETRDEGPESEG